MRNDVAVNAEIARLVKMKSRVRQRTAFGDDNHDAIDAQILVLTNRADNDEVYDRFGPSHDDKGKESFEFTDSCDHKLQAALEALMWLEGETKEAPSKGWKELMK